MGRWRGPVSAGSFDAASASEACLASGIPKLAFIDEVVPATGRGQWYLVRARNLCGIGSYGTESDGTPRNVQGCP